MNDRWFTRGPTQRCRSVAQQFSLEASGSPRGGQSATDRIIGRVQEMHDDLNDKIDGVKRDVDELHLRGPENGGGGRPRGISLAKLCRGITLASLNRRDPWNDCEYEREVLEESEHHRATMIAGQDTLGGYFVAPQFMPQSFIDKLWEAVVFAKLGVTHLPGLVGAPVQIPRKTGSTTAYYKGETAAPTATNPTLGLASLYPKALKGLSKLSKMSVMLSKPAYEEMVQNDLAMTIARRRELGVLQGVGGENEPLGLINTPAIGSSSISGVPSDLDDYAAMVYTIEAANADTPGARLAWLMNPREWHTLRLMKDGTGRYLLSRAPDGSTPKMLHGYPVVTTTAVPITLGAGAAGRVIFGNWADLCDCEWDGFTFDATDKSNDWWESGIVGILVTLYHDVLVRHAESFVVDDTVLAS